MIFTQPIDLTEFAPEDIQRFWSCVIKTETCWLWDASTNQSGYGQFEILTPDRERRIYLVHRISYYLYHNIDPYPHLVLHTCDVPLCVYPIHLYLGNMSKNMQDMYDRDRGKTKIKLSDIPHIKELAKTHTQSEIAKLYGVNQCNISRILNNKRWNR